MLSKLTVKIEFPVGSYNACYKYKYRCEVSSLRAKAQNLTGLSLFCFVFPSRTIGRDFSGLGYVNFPPTRSFVGGILPPYTHLRFLNSLEAAPTL